MAMPASFPPAGSDDILSSGGQEWILDAYRALEPRVSFFSVPRVSGHQSIVVVDGRKKRHININHHCLWYAQ